jgi:rhamnulokinase
VGGRIARVAAVDLGASSGRVFVAEVGADRLQLTEQARFAHAAVPVGGTWYWDLLGLYRSILDGVARAGRDGPLDAIGVDSWGVDYGLLRADGSLLGLPVSYRDDRTVATHASLLSELGPDEIFRRTGIALLRINTLYQLAADAAAGHLEGAAHLLFLPDLIGYLLSGRMVAEQTVASTSQLLSAAGAWDEQLVAAAGASSELLPEVVVPGTRLGPVRGDLEALRAITPPPEVIAVASHDTASAVVAVPAEDEDFAYISCGTWSLVGLELTEPVVTDAALAAGFTNEHGIDGTYRFLHNVMGLWLLQECMREWETDDLATLLAGAAAAPALRSVIDVDGSDLLAPGGMPARIEAACRHAGRPVPEDKAQMVRAILDSLAVSYRRSVSLAASLSGRPPARVVHLVGGGANNRLLCQLTADACGVPVLAGPVEAAAIGNALVQARALGAVPGDRGQLRRLVAAHVGVERYDPDPAMAARFADVASVSVARSGSGS